MSRFKIMVHQHAERLLHVFVYANIHIKRAQEHFAVCGSKDTDTHVLLLS